MPSPGVVVVVILLTIGAIGCIGAAGILMQRRFGSSSTTAYNNPFADPAPQSRGPFSWLTDRFRQFKAKSSRTAAGAYEGDTRYRSAADDDAWDHRVGREADGFGPYDEEFEMSSAAVNGSSSRHGAAGSNNNNNNYSHYTTTNTANPIASPYSGGDLGADVGQQMERGRSRTRSPPRVQVENPFGDNAEVSDFAAERDIIAKKVRSNISSDRRSVFREAVE